MSAAAKFRFKQPFPVCVPDLSGLGYSYLDNLTLAQVMPFAWNLEYFTFTMNGSATKGAASVTCNGSITTNPPNADRFDQGRGSGMWIPTVVTDTAWASWPGPIVPRERVCHGGTTLAQCFFLGDLSTDPSGTVFDIQFHIGTDPGNAGKYRIYYSFNIAYHNFTAPDGVQILFVDPATGGGGDTLWQTGSAAVGAFSFPWESYYTSGATPSGTGQIVSGSGDYTY